MATTPNLGMPVTAPEEVNKTFLEFRNDIYQSMITIDEALGDLRDGHGTTGGQPNTGGQAGTTVQADYAQNDQTAPDYIKNRPFYENNTEIRWDGNTNGRTNLASYNQEMYMFGEVIAPKLPSGIDEFPYLCICKNSTIDSDHTRLPYMTLYCSDVPMTYGNASGVLPNLGRYATNCTIVTYAWTDPQHGTWVKDTTTTYPNDEDIYFLSLLHAEWTNTDILKEDGSKYIEKSAQVLMLGDRCDYFKVSDNVLPYTYFSGAKFNYYNDAGFLTERSTSDMIVMHVSGSDTKYCLFASGMPLIASSDEAGTFYLRYNDVYMPLTFPEPGLYFVSYEDDSRVWLGSLIQNTVKKIDGKYIPWHIVTTSDVTSMDLSQFKEGDVIFLIGEATL